MLLTLLEKIQAKQQQSHPDGPPLPKMMVFLNTAAAAQAAYDAVAAAGYPAVPFHKEVGVGSCMHSVFCVAVDPPSKRRNAFLLTYLLTNLHATNN